MKKIINLLYYVFIVFLLIVPFWPLDSSINNIFIALFLPLIVLIIFFSDKKKIKIDIIDILLGLLPFFYILPFIFKENVSSFNENIHFILLELCLIYTIIILRRNLTKEKINTLLISVVVMSVLYFFVSIVYQFMPKKMMLVGIFSYFGDTYINSVDRFYGTITYCNSSALLFLIAMFISLFKINSGNKFIFRIIFFLNVAGFLVTFSKMLTIALIVVFVALLILLLYMKRYVSLNNIKINFIAVIIPSLLFVRIFRDYLISLNIVKFIFILVVLIILFLLMCEILIRLDKKFKYSSILCLILQIMVIAVFTIKPISIPLNIKSVLKDNSYIISDFILEANKEYNVDVSIEGNLEDLSIQLFRFYVDGIQPMEELVSEVDIADFDKFSFIARENTEYYFIRLVGLNKNTNIKVSNLRINGDEYLLNSFFIPYQYIHQLDLTKYDKESVSHRFLYYKDSIKILKDNGFLIGHGFNSFSYYTDIYEFNYLEKDPHSYLFSLLLDIGIYGLVYVVCLIIFGLLGMWKNRKRKSKAIWFCIFSLCMIVLPFDCIYSVMYMKVLLMLSFVMVSTVSVKDLRK